MSICVDNCRTQLLLIIFLTCLFFLNFFFPFFQLPVVLIKDKIAIVGLGPILMQQFMYQNLHGVAQHFIQDKATIFIHYCYCYCCSIEQYTEMKYQIFIVLLISNLCFGFWDSQHHGERAHSHKYSIHTSQTIANSIKAELLQNIDRFANITAAEELKSDLITGDRRMIIVDVVTANQMFGILGIKDPNCDINQDGYLFDNELRCLNKIWKYYVPKDGAKK